MEIVEKIRRKIRGLFNSWAEDKIFNENVALIKKLADSENKNSNIIIDCGFNQGLVAAKLLGKLPGFSLVGFEIQQDIKYYAERIKSKYPNRDINVIYSAVSDRNGFIDYFEPEKWGKNYKGGTTTVNNKESMSASYSNPKTAPCIDFAEWLRNSVKDDYFVFIKMDIEGAEYNVVEHLMQTGVIDLVDVLAVEWHAHKFPEQQKIQYIEVEKNIRAYAKNARVSVLDWY